MSHRSNKPSLFRHFAGAPACRAIEPDNSADREPDFTPHVSQWGHWMREAQAGNAGAYENLLTEIGGWMRRCYASRLPAANVDDAVRESLSAIHTKRHTYDPAEPFLRWMAAIARHKYIDYLRRS